MANSLDFDQALNELDVLLQSDFSAAQKKLAEYETAFSGLTPTQKGRLRIDRAISYIFVSEYAKALDDLRQAETLITSPELLASIYSYQATVYIGMRDYDKALSAVAKALALVVNIDDVTIKRHSYLRIANIYSEMDAYSDMGLYANKVLQLAQETDVRDICHAKLLRAIYLLGVKSPDALDAFEDSRQYCDAKQFPLLATMSMKGKGMVLQERGDNLGARAILLLALKGYEAFQFQLEISHVHALLAENYFATGEPVQAKSHAVKVLTFPDDNSYIEHKHIAYRVFAELMASDKQFEQAYEYSRKEQHYNQLIFDQSKMKTLAYQAAKFNADEQAREINLLNKERELYIAQQTVKEREYTNMLMFITILVGGLFFLAILLVVGNLQKRRFMRMARMDALTGVLNRGAGQDLGENLFVQAAARGGDFCVILFDLDYFKRINDSYGHGTGDWALKKVVEALKPHVRNGDVFARIGGEEFALFLPYANESKGMEVAEQCRSRIEAIDTHLSGHKFTITASFGVSGMTKEDLSLDPLLHRADMALYAAKSNGRNSVFCYEDALASDKRATNITSQLARH